MNDKELVTFATEQRWFRSKARTVKRGTVTRRAQVGGAELVALDVEYKDGEPETYVMAVRDGKEALAQPDFARALVDLVRREGEVDGVKARRGPGFDDAFGTDVPEPRLVSAEQSNSAVIYGDRAILKVYRKLSTGENPEVEILRALATRDLAVPRLVGTIEWNGAALAMLQQFVPNRGDAWSVTLASLGRFVSERAADVPTPLQGSLVATSRQKIPGLADEDVERARRLGRATAALHVALADSFGVETRTLRSDDLRKSAREVLKSLASEAKNPAVSRLLARAPDLDARIDAASDVVAPTIRVHGDYHLGQVLVRPDDELVIVDFEGEPARSLEERRAKASPFKDVAGMLRSYDYAAASVAANEWTAAWSSWVSAAFLGAWLDGVRGTAIAPQSDAQAGALLDRFLFEKALYEIEYERNNRPTWLAIPVSGLLSLLDRPSA